jgi:hypothetical protein
MTESTENQRDKLASELGSGPWSLLSAHAQSGSLIMVKPEADFLDVAIAVANDDASRVGQWIQDGTLSREYAPAASSESAFNFIVVNPFVLAQTIPV